MKLPETTKSLAKRFLAIAAAVVCVILIYLTVRSGQSDSPEYQSAAYATILSIIPPLLAIALALITKEVYSWRRFCWES